MRFVINQAGCSSERIGSLRGFVKSPTASIETPASALFTQSGSVVHLTNEVLAKVFTNPKLLWVPLSKSYQLETGLKAQGEGVAKFAGLQNHLTCVTLHAVSEVTPTGHFESDLVPLWTKNGKKMISANRYMDLMEVFKPDIILAIADGHTSLDESFKRITKSLDRTSNMLNLCVTRQKASANLQDSSLIGVIVGVGDERKCDQSIRNLLTHKDSLSGVALEGITNGTEESLAVPIEKLEAIFKRVSNAIPKDFLRIIEGCWNPAVIVTAIEYGWDLFDGSYPLKLTNAGHALALNLSINKTSNENRKDGDDQDSKELCILDLNDERYKDDFQPILVNCECLSCKKHTRAYIRHLLNTREMLSSVLLSIHNLHHFDQLFHHARLHIASRTFDAYKRHIIQQYDLYKQRLKDTTTEVIQVNMNNKKQKSKRLRVSDDDTSNVVNSNNSS
ncbi:queuine tRNA-ribosyltransferase accessory subunit 2 [Achroia grisella]|uniref:queuine tRNA-ribosyltransferase accessory subunit 2 n=1 Tax=Achroia grisella TaxID=688607 RepID=UPI0027D27CD8|nr:queuine tRNA-ribosyltransferase accessory subunit 2 [Achroia grisella]